MGYNTEKLECFRPFIWLESALKLLLLDVLIDSVPISQPMMGSDNIKSRLFRGIFKKKREREREREKEKERGWIYKMGGEREIDKETFIKLIGEQESGLTT